MGKTHYTAVLYYFSRVPSLTLMDQKKGSALTAVPYYSEP